MSNTFLDILNRMKESIETEADKREGTWTADNLQSVSQELARIYSMDIDPVLDKAFVSKASGSYLDLACGDYGINRKPATYASVEIEVTGTPGKYGEIRCRSGDLVFRVLPFVIEEAGTAIVEGICTTAGKVGNVEAGTINETDAAGITKVRNPQAAAGGYDKERDTDLRERTLEKIRQPVTGGNIAHYIQWAKEVPGVLAVKVFPLARGNGTVDVVIVADEFLDVSQELLQDVQKHIEDNRPIGADVLVSVADKVTITISAVCIVAEGHTASGITSVTQEALKKYFQDVSVSNQKYVSYMKIVSLLFDAGVQDVKECLLNGKDESIFLEERQYPAVGNIEVVISDA